MYKEQGYMHGDWKRWEEVGEKEDLNTRGSRRSCRSLAFIALSTITFSIHSPGFIAKRSVMFSIHPADSSFIISQLLNHFIYGEASP